MSAPSFQGVLIDEQRGDDVSIQQHLQDDAVSQKNVGLAVEQMFFSSFTGIQNNLGSRDVSLWSVVVHILKGFDINPIEGGSQIIIFDICQKVSLES